MKSLLDDASFDEGTASSPEVPAASPVPVLSPDVQILSSDEQNLINETIDLIENVFQEAIANVYYKVGELILSKIFNGDHKGAKEVISKTDNTIKSHLFNALRDQMDSRFKNKKIESGLPQKTWLYNSIKLVLDKKLIEDSNQQNVIEEYNSLNISQKINLLPVKELKDKEVLISKIHKEGLSVREARGLISDTPGKKNLGLLSYISNPAEIVDVESVMLVGGKKNKEAVKKAKDKIKAMEAKIDEQKEHLEKLKKLLSKLEKYEPSKGRKKRSRLTDLIKSEPQ